MMRRQRSIKCIETGERHRKAEREHMRRVRAFPLERSLKERWPIWDDPASNWLVERVYETVDGYQARIFHIKVWRRLITGERERVGKTVAYHWPATSVGFCDICGKCTRAELLKEAAFRPHWNGRDKTWFDEWTEFGPSCFPCRMKVHRIQKGLERCVEVRAWMNSIKKEIVNVSKANDACNEDQDDRRTA